MDRIRAARVAKGWSQHELAARAGVSRQQVSSIEAGRHVPSVTAALAIARALQVSVEDMFADDATGSGVEPVVPFGRDEEVARGPVVTVRVRDRVVGVPIDSAVTSAAWWALADAVRGHGDTDWFPSAATDGLLLAGCDPALGLLAALVGRTSGHRVVAVHASSVEAVEALADGRAHGAVVHGPTSELPAPPPNVRRWCLARWQVGLASSTPSGPPTIDEVVDRNLRVVQRPEGAASQRAFDRALGRCGATRAVPGPIAAGHVDVARRVRAGGTLVGVTMEAAAVAFGLGFAPLEVHEVELCIDRDALTGPAADALVGMLDSRAYRHRLATFAGYDLVDLGREVR